MILTKPVADLIDAFVTKWQGKGYQSVDELSTDIEEIGHELNSIDDLELVDILPSTPQPVSTDG